jgi:hypothetical protein
MNNKIYLVVFVLLFSITTSQIMESISSKEIQNSNLQYISNLSTISVDGSIYDWASIQPSLDHSGEPINLNREIKSVYIAHDAENIFFLLDLYYLQSDGDNYVTNITILNSLETIYYIQTMYSTLSYNTPSHTFMGYARDFNSDFITWDPWIYESSNSSSAGFEHINDTIDLVHLELQIPTEIILKDIPEENRFIQIKFWYMFDYGSPSSEAGLVLYDLTFDPNKTKQDTSNSSSTTTNLNTTSSHRTITTTDVNVIDFLPLIFVVLILKRSKN